MNRVKRRKDHREKMREGYYESLFVISLGITIMVVGFILKH